MLDDPTNLDLLISLLVVSCVILGMIFSLRSGHRLSPIGVIVIGGGLSRIWGVAWSIASNPAYASRHLVINFDLTREPLQSLYWWFAVGLYWLLIYETMSLVPVASWSRRIAAVVAVNLVSHFYFTAASAVQAILVAPGGDSSWLPTMDGLKTAYSSPQFMVGLAMAAMQVWVVSLWIRRSAEASTGSGAAFITESKGVLVSKRQNQSTRLLCASVLLNHGGARGKLLGWLKDRNRAVAMELGIDLHLVAQIAKFAERRANLGWWLYFGISCVTGMALMLADGSPFPLAIGGFAAAVVWTKRSIYERNTLAPLFAPEKFDPAEVAQQFPAELDPDCAQALPEPNQNFFVYGGFTPFVGAGHDIGGWSVVIPLDKPKREFGNALEITPFELDDLYAAIDSGLVELRIRGIERKDCFFASGTDIREHRDLLPDMFSRPVQRLDNTSIAEHVASADDKVRHYRCYRVLDWGGELALSYYMRCSQLGSSLFVETRRFILTPLDEKYRSVDAMAPMGFKEQLAAAIAGLFIGPAAAVVAPGWAAIQLSRFIGEILDSEGRQKREFIRKNLLFNYGTATSLRQVLSSGAYGHYFQKMDGDLYSKLFEHEVLDTLVDFLDSRGIDTSDLKERQTTILNNGVIVQGGDVKTEALAVGVGSTAIKRTTKALTGLTFARGDAQ